jgi:MFS superfamily sulfate permease-like transporter
LPETNTASLVLGLVALALLVLGKVYLKNQPVALAVVIASIGVAAFTDLGTYGVKLLGEVPQGLPAVGLPAIRWADVNELLPLALACFLLGAVETRAAVRDRPRAEGIDARLGGVGRFNTIADAVDGWKAPDDARPAPPSRAGSG